MSSVLSNGILVQRQPILNPPITRSSLQEANTEKVWSRDQDHVNSDPRDYSLIQMVLVLDGITLVGRRGWKVGVDELRWSSSFNGRPLSQVYPCT